MQLEQFKYKFIEEATKLICQLEESLLNNENALSDSESIHQIFRVMHTLKGVSSMYGFNHISDISHELESIFDQVREGQRKFTAQLFDIILQTVDHFRNLLNDENLTEENNQRNQSLLLDSVKKISGADIPKAVNIDVQESVSGFETFYVIFRPDDSFLNRGISILKLFEELADLGQYTIVNHSFKEHGDVTDDEFAWGVYLVTDRGVDAIEDVFIFVLENCHILKIATGNMLDKDEFIAKLDRGECFQQPSVSVPECDDVVTEIEPSVMSKNEIDELDNVIFKERSVVENRTIEQVGSAIARISVDSSKLDRLMYLVSELVIAKSQLLVGVEKDNYEKITEAAQKIEALTQGFRETTLNIRLVPVAEMIVPFKRLVRDLSKSLGKKVNFITQGIDTELDKNVIDRLAEPVMHILRNCVDHGIEDPQVRVANNKTEEGMIKFTSFYSGANVFIQIQDDGAGIDPEKIRKKAIEKRLISQSDKLTENEIINLIFLPGFSTADSVTDISGRGVGMDIVRKKIEEVRGEVDINSEIGLGSFFTIKLHQTLSIIDTLLLKVDNLFFLVPVSDIEFVDQAAHQHIYGTHNKQVALDDDLIPYVSLRDLFTENKNYPAKEKLVVVNKNDKRIAILADQIIGNHQAVLKPLGEVFRSQQFLSGASMLGDGSLAMMLDINKLSNSSITGNTVA